MIGTAKGLAALGLIVAAMLWSIAVGVQAQTSAEAAVRRPGIDIAVLVSSRGDLCYDPGDVAAITRLATLEQQRINAEGGIAGRAVRLVILDDERDQTKTNDNLRKAIADPATLALIGLTNSRQLSLRQPALLDRHPGQARRSIHHPDAAIQPARPAGGDRWLDAAVELRRL